MNMRLELRAEGIPMTEGLRDFIERKVRLALGRCGQRVRRVRVRLTDVNGPKKGEDIRCNIQASVIPAGTLTIDEQRCDPFAAVARATARVGYRLARHLERLDARRKGR
jgi:ribosome-associated translation inhibitor RaiA